VVRTSASHAGNTSSNLVGVTTKSRDSDSGQSPLMRCGKYVSRKCTLDLAPVQVPDTFGVLLYRASLQVSIGKHRARLRFVAASMPTPFASSLQGVGFSLSLSGKCSCASARSAGAPSSSRKRKNGTNVIARLNGSVSGTAKQHQHQRTHAYVWPLRASRPCSILRRFAAGFSGYSALSRCACWRYSRGPTPAIDRNARAKWEGSL